MLFNPYETQCWWVSPLWAWREVWGCFVGCSQAGGAPSSSWPRSLPPEDRDSQVPKRSHIPENTRAGSTFPREHRGLPECLRPPGAKLQQNLIRGNHQPNASAWPGWLHLQLSSGPRGFAPFRVYLSLLSVPCGSLGIRGAVPHVPVPADVAAGAGFTPMHGTRGPVII